jgi:predicted HAD superfamily Cof-like phosphohydrolase
MQADRYLDDVGAFHAKFGLDSQEPSTPTVPSDEMVKFRLNFLLEELCEIAAANDFVLSEGEDEELHFEKCSSDICEDAPDHIKLEHTLDGLVDLLYIIAGTVRFFGLHTVGPTGVRFHEAWRRVQQCNMRKVRTARPADSKRGSGFDVVKPEGWVGPDHKDLV